MLEGESSVSFGEPSEYDRHFEQKQCLFKFFFSFFYVFTILGFARLTGSLVANQTS